jgi:hypothetical protein
MKKILPFMAVFTVLTLAVSSADARGRRPDEGGSADTTTDTTTTTTTTDTTTDTGVPTGTPGETFDRSGTTTPTDATGTGTSGTSGTSDTTAQ